MVKLRDAAAMARDYAFTIFIGIPVICAVALFQRACDWFSPNRGRAPCGDAKAQIKRVAVLVGTLALATGVALGAVGDGQPVKPNDQIDAMAGKGTSGLWKPLMTDAAGNLLMGNAPQNVRLYYPVVIQNVKAAAGAPDSCAPQPGFDANAGYANRWGAYLYWTPPVNAAGVLFALQVRGHRVQSGDSLSTFAWQAHEPSIFAKGIAFNDTTAVVGLWSTMTVAARDTLCLPSEIPVFVSSTIQPRGRFIQFYSNGEWFGGADYVSIRVRVLNTINSSGNAIAAGSEGNVTFKWSLVGWRE